MVRQRQLSACTKIRPSSGGRRGSRSRGGRKCRKGKRGTGAMPGREADLVDGRGRVVAAVGARGGGAHVEDDVVGGRRVLVVLCASLFQIAFLDVLGRGGRRTTWLRI